MLRFQHNEYLFVLILLPLLVGVYVWMLLWRKKKLLALGDERLVKEQLRGYIPGRNTARFFLLAMAFTGAVIGWANLQRAGESKENKRKGIDVVIALDVSKSMLAKDIQPDRLTRAKQLITRILDKMENDRAALVVFAGRSYLQVPLTSDYNAMKMLLQTTGPDLVPTQGTVIGDAIDLANNAFSQKEKKYKSLIIISDGEDHDEEAQQKAKSAAEDGVVIHTVGVGSPEGANLFDPATNAPKLDENGKPVLSKLNEGELQSLAKTGKGTYTLLNNPENAADKIMHEIAGMEQKSFGTIDFVYSSYFQYFLGFALLLLIMEWIIPGTDKKRKLQSA